MQLTTGAELAQPFVLVRPLECFGGFWWRRWTDAEQQELEGQELQIKLRSICHGQQLI